MSRLRQTAELCRNDEQRRVYVIGGDGGTTKVGISMDPSQRIRDLKTGSGRFGLRVVKQWECGNRARSIEHRAHVILESNRAGGEWFNCTPEQAITAVEIAIELFSAVVLLREDEKTTDARGDYGKRRYRAMHKITATPRRSIA